MGCDLTTNHIVFCVSKGPFYLMWCPDQITELVRCHFFLLSVCKFVLLTRYTRPCFISWFNQQLCHFTLRNELLLLSDRKVGRTRSWFGRGDQERQGLKTAFSDILLVRTFYFYVSANLVTYCEHLVYQGQIILR